MDGSAPDHSPAVLLLIDVLNDFNYPGGDQLLRNALQIAPNLCELKARARQAQVATIYVHDNFGRWRASFQDLLAHCLEPGSKAEPFVRQVAPDEQDYFILKPKHSGFYQTPLDLLLKHLGSKHLIVAGLSTNSCVLITSHDAYMRDLELTIPPDCVAAITPAEHEAALEQMRNVLKARTPRSGEIDWATMQ